MPGPYIGLLNYSEYFLIIIDALCVVTTNEFSILLNDVIPITLVSLMTCIAGNIFNN